MKKREFLFDAGAHKVSAMVYEPTKPAAALVLAHGAGAGMKHPFMEQLSVLLADHSIATMRYNFPYMEAGKKRPDLPAVATKAVMSAISKTEEIFQDTPLFAGGKSFGGRMTSTALSQIESARILGIVFYGFPLHPPGNPGVTRADHLFKVKQPMLFLQGTRDTLADLKLLTGVADKLSAAELIVFDGADHSFKRSGGSLLPELAQRTAEWVNLVIKPFGK